MADKTTFTIEESAALLRAIFPNWPDLRGRQPVPEPSGFLEEFRRKKAEQQKQSEEVMPKMKPIDATGANPLIPTMT